MGKKVAGYLKDARTAEIPLGGHQVLFCHMHVFSTHQIEASISLKKEVLSRLHQQIACMTTVFDTH